jgi:hypothetical protein
VKKRRGEKRQGHSNGKMKHNPTSHAVVQCIFFKYLLDSQHLLNALNRSKARRNQKMVKYKVVG